MIARYCITGRFVKRIAVFISCAILVFNTAGCGKPTYPKEKFKESIIRLCKSEYKLDVKVATKGKTVVIYLPLPNLIDFTFAITKSASEKINNVILSVTRVAISTDADYDFYVIIAHDVRIPEIQIIIIKSVDDVKRFLLGSISRDDYSKRMLIDMRLNPQAQKERSVREVFEKMGLDPKWQDQVMNDFFRSEPTALSDIGYWNGRFYVKDILLGEFIADQIASRIRMVFRDDAKIAEKMSLKLAKGSYLSKGDKRYFKIETMVQAKILPEASDSVISENLMGILFKTASDVIWKYKFDDFDYLEIYDQTSSKSVKFSKEDLEAVKKKEKKIEDLIK
ncbi:MAG TPA: hypothetical protein PLV52_01045 [Candidatus Omnitrophota bacterium]|nr:hypothetical protein [Candidatus Omnitrophota bacterium]